ncbi:MAG: mannonate dehydratase, partial [Bacteroidota bacterium]
MIHTMRWFGPQDPVPLMHIQQAGCSGIVTALHQIPVGQIWTKEEIQERIEIIEKDNDSHSSLHWLVVESLPVHEDIKKGLPSREKYIENYIESLENLAAKGIFTVCYNFMPVLDWSRTNLTYRFEDGSEGLRFDMIDFACFDLFILKRPNSKNDYSEEIFKKAEEKFLNLNSTEKKALENTVLLGLPGSEEAFELSNFQDLLNNYKEIGERELKENLFYFIQKIGPSAKRLGIKLCIHPDDPPMPLLGLPRVVSTDIDLEELMNAFDEPCNGITFCTGSLGVRPDNNINELFKKYANRVHFLHLRTTKRESES